MLQTPPSENSAEASDTTGESQKSLARFRSYAQSKYPAFALSALFGVASVVPYTVFPRHTYIAPFLHRVGFSAFFGGAGYAISVGDVRNGSGIATAWSLTYLFLHLRKSFRTPRNPLSLALAGGTAVGASLYGTEYFIFQS